MEAELDVSEIRRKITLFVKEKVESSQAEGLVFELDGSVNSAVTAHLCVEAVGTRRVAGLLMPDLRTADERDIADAKTIGNELCLAVKQVDIAPIHKAFMKGAEESRTAEENLRERIRMSLLYYHADTTNRLVVGSLDKSEALLGNFAKYGDGGVDILPIADLYKTDVRKLGEVLGIKRRIVAKKSEADAWRQPSKLYDGIDRDTTDQVLKLKFERDLDASAISETLGKSRAIVDSVIEMYDSSLHKKRIPEICFLN